MDRLLPALKLLGAGLAVMLGTLLVVMLTSGALSWLWQSLSRPQSHVAVLDGQGMCWIGSEGRATSSGAIIYASGGTLTFHGPIVVFVHAGHVPEKAVARVLQTNLKHCLRVSRSR